MATYDGVVLQVSLQCPGCHQPVHVQGLGEQELCPACQHQIPLSQETWIGWFGPAQIAEALSFGEGEARQVQSLGGNSAKWAFGHRMPRCQSCKTPVPEDELAAAAAAGAWICPCGERVRVRAAPELAALLVPGARFVVNEGAVAVGDGTAEPAGSAAPVMFACMACGGALEVDGRARTITCKFCGGSNFLPDALWLRLHPARTVRTFFVVLERGGRGPLSPELLRKLGESDDSDARAIAAANHGASEKLLSRLGRDDDSDVRAAVARNPSTPVAEVDRLLADDDADVRAAAVRSGRASQAALIRQLAVEPDRDVVRVVADLVKLDPLVLSALARNSDYEARVVAAQHPATSEPDLVRLATLDTDSDVLRALLQRPALPADALRALARNDDEAIAEKARSRSDFLPIASASRRRVWILVGLAAAVTVCVGGGGGLVALAAGAAKMLMRRHF